MVSHNFQMDHTQWFLAFIADWVIRTAGFAGIATLVPGAATEHGVHSTPDVITQIPVHRCHELYRHLLGLLASWEVDQVERSVTDGRVDVWVRHPGRTRFGCPDCNTPLPVYDHSAERAWRHLDSCAFLTPRRRSSVLHRPGIAPTEFGD